MADGRLFNTVDHEGSPTNLGLHSWQLQRTHTVDTDLSRGKPQRSTYKSASITFSTHNNYMLQATSVSLHPTGTAPSYSDEYLYVKKHVLVEAGYRHRKFFFFNFQRGLTAEEWNHIRNIAYFGKSHYAINNFINLA